MASDPLLGHSGSFPWDARAIARIEDATEGVDEAIRQLRVRFHTGGSALIKPSYYDGPCLAVEVEAES